MKLDKGLNRCMFLFSSLAMTVHKTQWLLITDPRTNR